MNILITGACGQLGSELVLFLRNKYPESRVLSTDIRPCSNIDQDFFILDVTNYQAITNLIQQESITHIYHLAAILSGKGEQNPQLAFQVNMIGTSNILEASRENGVKQVFIPSSIAVFGDYYPQDMTPNDTVLRPRSMYGVTKVAGELLHEYYTEKYGLDVRGLRFPGIISYAAEPGGGTTDFAVDIFHWAARGQQYPCFLKADTLLPFMYMPDVLTGIIQLMEAPASHLTRRSYNITAFSASPRDFLRKLQEVYPDFHCSWEPDFRQAIADRWPRTIDDSLAQKDWNWCPQYGLGETCKDMANHITPSSVS